MRWIPKILRVLQCKKAPEVMLSILYVQSFLGSFYPRELVATQYNLIKIKTGVCSFFILST